VEQERADSLAEVEQKILEELMEVVRQRDALVALLEEDRLKSVVGFFCVFLPASRSMTLCFLTAIFQVDLG